VRWGRGIVRFKECSKKVVSQERVQTSTMMFLVRSIISSCLLINIDAFGILLHNLEEDQAIAGHFPPSSLIGERTLPAAFSWRNVPGECELCSCAEL
jgi:hypothetical protein